MLENRVITSTTLTTLATIIVIILSNGATIPVIATTTGNTTATTATATTTTTPSSLGLEFSTQPVWEEVTTITDQTPINETHIIGTFTRNGTLNLPNSAEEAINITSYGSVIGSIIDNTGVGEEVISTVDGTESATQKFYGIARFNMEDGTGRAIVIALVHTNSTGRLAPLDGMILVGTHEEGPNIPTAIDTIFRYWEWESGIPLPTDITTTATTIPALG
jgi:hypothetical protein